MNARPLLALAAVLTTGLLVGTTAYAAPTETRSVTVSYADLDIARPADRAILERRIVVAADRICANPGERDIRSLMEARECRTAALADARPKVELAMLKASSQQYAARGSDRGR